MFLAGCSAPFQSSDKRTILDSDIEIAAGEYRTVEFELEEQREVEFGMSEIENADTVPAGEFVVVFDNTDRSEATPDGAVSGHARVELSPPN